MKVEVPSIESDQPIQTSTEDRFGRSNFAQRIAQVIAKRTDSSSIVIGIHAPWGEGKTSVLNMITEELDKHENVEYLRFNPWRFPDEVQLLKHFFNVLAEKIDASIIRTREKISGFIRKYADGLAPLSAFGIDAADAVKAATEAIPDADIEELKRRVEAELIAAKKRIVVIMDDIDRLDKEEVQAVFKLVKLSADFPQTAYILSFDEQMVAAALAEKYGSIDAGRNFLEKIIQVSLPLPPASPEALMSLTIEGIRTALSLAEIELTDEQHFNFANKFDKAFRSRLGTPRLSKRLANALTFALPLVKGELDPLDLIFIEAIRAFYPTLYSSIRDNEEVYLATILESAHSSEAKRNASQEATVLIETALGNLHERQKNAVKEVLQELFPQTGMYGLFRHGSRSVEAESDWTKGKRIASKKYFRRYFTYGVQPHDVSDNEVDRFLGDIQERGVDFVVENLKRFAASGRERIENFISKLRLYENELDERAAKTLAMGIALSGGVFPKHVPVDRFFGFGASAQATMLIRVLLEQIQDQTERENFAIELAERIVPLPFAYDYSSWMRPVKRSHYSDEKVSVVSSECESRIRKIIAARIASEAREEPIENKYTIDAQNLYQLWFAQEPESLRAYLDSRLRERPQDAAQFLAAILSVSKSGNDIDIPEAHGWYDLITKMVEPEIIMRALREQYDDLDSPRIYIETKEIMSAEKRAARWFFQMHQQASAEVAPQADMAPEPSKNEPTLIESPQNDA
jgi:predicted KAP-like P-loop ATPase